MSDKKTDKRILHSKRFIKEALIELMKTKNVARISVLELCKKADINRNTFYAHYSTPEDVLNEIENELKREYEAIVLGQNGDMIDALRFTKDHADVLGVLVENPGSDFRDYLFAISRELYLKRCREGGITDSETAEKIYMYTSAGANQITAAWIQDGCQQPIAEVLDFMEAMLAACISVFTGDQAVGHGNG